MAIGYANVNFTAVQPKGRASRSYRPCRRFTRPWRMDLTTGVPKNPTLYKFTAYSQDQFSGCQMNENSLVFARPRDR